MRPRRADAMVEMQTVPWPHMTLTPPIGQNDLGCYSFAFVSVVTWKEKMTVSTLSPYSGLFGR